MRPLSRRGLLATGAAALLGGPARAAAPDLSGLILRVGDYRGLDHVLLPGTGLARAPYAIAFSEFAGGNLITQAIDADALDYGSWSEIPLVFAAASGAQIKVIATLEGPTTDQAVLVPKGSPARSIADLRGRRVGYIRATTAHYFLIRMLAQHGMSFSDIQPVALGMSAGLTAMRAGSLDAWATYGYAIPTLELDEGARILQTARGILSGNYLIGANPRHLDDPRRRALLADYVRRIGQAYRILGADKPRWAKLTAPVIGVPEPVVLAYLDAFDQPLAVRPTRPSDIASAQGVADTFARAGLLPAGTRVADSFSDAITPLLAAS